VYGTGNPCPICRDEYLVVSHKNLKLLSQFVSPDSGYVRSVNETSNYL
jgi:small subunit ribosomal protein S18b, mitochondrial